MSVTRSTRENSLRAINLFFAFRSFFHHLWLKSVHAFSFNFTASRDTELLFECTYVPVIVTAFALREIGPTSPMKFATSLIEGS